MNKFITILNFGAVFFVGLIVGLAIRFSYSQTIIPEVTAYFVDLNIVDAETESKLWPIVAPPASLGNISCEIEEGRVRIIWTASVNSPATFTVSAEGYSPIEVQGGCINQIEGGITRSGVENPHTIHLTKVRTRRT